MNEGFVAAMFILCIGCLFGGGLFGFTATSCKDKIAAKISGTLFFLSVLFVGLGVFGALRVSKQPVYEFRVNAHFIDGYSRVYTITSKHNPHIESHRGTYWLNTNEGRILGVIRCDVLSKKEVKSQ